ncbi:MFS transporter [Actinorugispora endophytica]|uniref:Nitrate/nitrite transporter NarK n=1 Tax=Actinorugispora endophytica TaxID=1605990 RepID=A0A4R6UXT8_9ACTN|nr:MFS transporter [Actinorugispora endophytica]TDQ52259.1 nitrate/nitrite transporter NarK [Actinorugispora endophytica]
MTTVSTRSTSTAAAALLRRWWLLGRVRDVPGTTRLLLLTQLAFNVGFYLVLPFLALHLSGDLMLAGWAVGLVLGVRAFSQQGLFALGGVLADRYGTRPVVLSGCVLRVAGFVLLAMAGDLWSVLAGAVLTGLAAALFSPAVEAALAEQGTGLERLGTISRAELFALFAVCGEVGAVAGPLLGALLLRVDFTAVCLAAAGVFVLIGLALARWLPYAPPRHEGEPLLAGWGEVLGNRVFWLFALCYSGYQFSYHQLYLALPVELGRAGDRQWALGWLFAMASVLIVLCQLPLADWARNRLGSGRALPLGFALLSSAFAVVAFDVLADPGWWPLAPAVAMVALLTLGQMLAVATAQDLVPRLAGERRLGVYFGFLSSVGGVAVLLGGTAVGRLLDDAGGPGGHAALPWLVLAAVPAVGGLALRFLMRRVNAWLPCPPSR